LLSGQVQLYFGTTASSLEYVRAGKLHALAVTIERRLDVGKVVKLSGAKLD